MHILNLYLSLSNRRQTCVVNMNTIKQARVNLKKSFFSSSCSRPMAPWNFPYHRRTLPFRNRKSPQNSQIPFSETPDTHPRYSKLLHHFGIGFFFQNCLLAIQLTGFSKFLSRIHKIQDKDIPLATQSVIRP